MNPLIAFSTLACPEWDIHAVIGKASEYGYGGIEWRGGPQGHVSPLMTPAERRALRQGMETHGVAALAVTTYTSFVSSELRDRQANLDELKRYLDLAAEIGAGHIRVFLGELPAGESLAAAYPRILACLEEGVKHAGAAGVMIAIEPHDEFVRTASILPILQQIDHPALGVIWDFGNAYFAGEEPETGIDLLKGRIAYVQIKDGRRRGNSWQLCPVRQGDVPLGKVFHLLRGSGYAGALSFEWERAWHPELDPPMVALPAALKAILEILAQHEPVASDRNPI
jgi:sugar phosphate isomerase/epimerase